VLGNYTTALADYLPARRTPISDLQNDLRSAGYYRPTAVIEYRAIRNLLVLLFVLATGAAALLLPGQILPQVVAVGLVVAGLAFSLPRVFLVARGRLRSHAIERGLPLAIDMLILCLSSGQNLLAALQQVARQLRKNNPILAQELSIAHQQADLHSLEHALSQWADRVRLPEVRNLVMLLIQSEKLGADAAVTLSELANNFRATARQRAETQANRTSFWMLFPSVFCFWVAAAIVLIGPAYLDFLQYQNRAPELFNNSLQTIKNANPTPPPATSMSQGEKAP
jgi:tight adherence protein C